MTHEEARDLLTDRLLDELGDAERRRLEAHLRECGDCRATALRWASSWEALASLASVPVDPAAHVRFGRRLERETRRAGLMAPRRRVPLLVAAAVALLLAGGLLGRGLAPGPRAEGGGASAALGHPRFMLVLRGDAPDRRYPADVLVAEYKAWAGTLTEAGALVTGAELEQGTGRWVAPATESDPTSTRLAGFFLIRAPSYDSALAIAQESPHAAYGGVIEVRRIVDAP